MANAVWLFLAVPNWYFSTILSPFAAGPLTEIPTLGIVALAIGVVLGIVRREKGLLIFLLLPAASQILVVIAGFLRGSFRSNDSQIGILIWAFVLLQIAGAAYFLWRLKGARGPATALTLFTSSYALFAAFVAGMAFSDNWL